MIGYNLSFKMQEYQFIGETIMHKPGQKYRLLTRNDLDGLVCAVLIKHLGIIESIELVDHPGSIQNRKMPVSGNIISANLPYMDGVHLAFDHHFSETIRNTEKPGHIIDPDAPSAARVVYEYFGGKKTFPSRFDEMMDAVDKADSGNFTKDEILYPEKWPLLNFLIDKRTGLEDWHDFPLKGEKFGLFMIDCMAEMSIDGIMEQQPVKQRVEIYFKYENSYKNQISRLAEVQQNVLILDFRKTKKVYPGNRFIPYALFPRCNVSVTIRQDRENPENVTISAGKSVINRSSSANIGEIMLSYGGGGHRAAGACHVNKGDCERVNAEIIEKLSGSAQ